MLPKATEVSIVMPAYNAEATIKASIESVISQTYTNWELVIVDDCSKDATKYIASTAAQKDKRIYVLTNERNMGVASTRNTAMAQVQGKWIAFLDSDDLWHESKLERQLQCMTEHGAAISYTATAYINEAGQRSSFILRAKNKLSYSGLLRRNLMSCSSVIVSKAAMVPFEQGDMHEDYVAWLRILRQTGYALGLDMPLLTYRISANSKSTRRVRSSKMLFRAYRQVGYGRIVSWLLTIQYALHSIPKRVRIRFG